MAAEYFAEHHDDQLDQIHLSSVAENIALQADMRVMYVNDQGMVVGDSVRVGGLLNQTLDHEDVQTALEGEVSSSTSYSTKIKQEIKQMAIPVKEEDNTIIGVIFLSTSLEKMNQTIGDMRMFLTLFTILLAIMLVSGGYKFLIDHYRAVKNLLRNCCFM